MAEQLFDVVVYEIESGRVASIPGVAMPRDGRHSAETRTKTVEPRLNDSYTCKIVPTGFYVIGDIIASEKR